MGRALKSARIEPVNNTKTQLIKDARAAAAELKTGKYGAHHIPAWHAYCALLSAYPEHEDILTEAEWIKEDVQRQIAKLQALATAYESQP
jgi:hypothetical protein